MEHNGDNMLTILNVLVLCGVIVIGWLVRAWLPKYLKKKAENFATKEDFKNLLELEKTSTKEIESIIAKISTGAWVDQRRWDLKRELYSRLLEVFHELRKTTANVATMYSPAQDKQFIERNIDFYEKQKVRQFELIDEAGRLTAVATLIVDNKAIEAIERFSEETNILDGQNDSYKYMMGLSDSADHVFRLLLTEARKDLLSVNDERTS